MNYITRTFETTNATVGICKVVDGKPTITDTVSFALDGHPDETTILKHANKTLGKATGRIVVEVDTVSELRGITVDDFIKHSVPMENARTPLNK